MPDVNNLIEKVKAYNPEADVELIRRAYEFSPTVRTRIRSAYPASPTSRILLPRLRFWPIWKWTP